jgi:glycosyltransferase involved in cell wall biosynthesis
VDTIAAPKGSDLSARRRWRVLQVHTPHREFGGEDVIVEAERHLLESHGHTVHQLLVGNPSGTLAAAGALALAPWNRESARRALQEAERFSPDVVHVHNTWFALSPAAVSALAGAGFPVVVTLHNFRTVCANGLLQRNGRPCTLCVGSHPGHAVLHRCYRNSATLSVPAALTIGVARRRGVWARDVRSFLVLDESAVPALVAGGVPEDRIIVRPNYVLDAEPRAAPPSESNEVVYAGRLSREKGPQILVEAWRRAAFADLTLLIYGDGPLRPELEALSVPRVRFMGRAPRAEVSQALGRARALVFPSTCQEAGPVAPLEAAAAGTPILMSDVVGMAGTLQAHGAGWQVRADDPSALATALAQLIDNDAVDRAGLAARALHRRRHSPERAIKTLEDAYQQAHDRQVTPR